MSTESLARELVQVSTGHGIEVAPGVTQVEAMMVNLFLVAGESSRDWVLVDAGDVIVHVFRPEVRQFYNLEKMWGGDRPAEQKAERRA